MFRWKLYITAGIQNLKTPKQSVTTHSDAEEKTIDWNKWPNELHGQEHNSPIPEFQMGDHGWIVISLCIGIGSVQQTTSHIGLICQMVESITLGRWTRDSFQPLQLEFSLFVIWSNCRTKWWQSVDLSIFAGWRTSTRGHFIARLWRRSFSFTDFVRTILPRRSLAVQWRHLTQQQIQYLGFHNRSQTLCTTLEAQLHQYQLSYNQNWFRNILNHQR